MTTSTSTATNTSTTGTSGSATGFETMMMTDPGSGGITESSSGGESTGVVPDPFCGDGNVDAGEECDEGENNDNNGTCTVACMLPVCGDGYIQGEESCDDGNEINEDSCLATCVANECGDGYVGPGEACDAPGDPECTDSCALASCGDGIVQENEGCDDGNQEDGDACLNTCIEASCGDGIVYEGVELCDDGNSDENDGCTSLCMAAACDDGIQSGDESDVDCGGSCGPCDTGLACTDGSDCNSYVCDAGICTLGASCLAIKLLSPDAPTGLYTIDIDGDGPEAEMEAFCEMAKDGGGWTLVQRTVWDSGDTADLFTNIDSWVSETIGGAGPGKSYRMAGKHWVSLNVEKRHMLAHYLRKEGDGSSCGALYYRGNGGKLAINGNQVTMSGLSSNVNMINNTQLSTTNSGPSQVCVNTHKAVPWFYSGCCSTCPTFAGGYWQEPHPMVNYTKNVNDIFGKNSGVVCSGETPISSNGYYGVNSMEYYLR